MHALNLDIGELHCADKHICAVYENLGEIIEKLVRLNQINIAEDLSKIREITKGLYFELNFKFIRRIIKKPIEEMSLKKLVEFAFDVLLYVDKVRKVRAGIHQASYKLLATDLDEKTLEATFIEFLKCIGNTYHIELHLLDFCQVIYKIIKRKEKKEKK